MNNINHHPHDEWLDAFAAGELPGGRALLVAAHLEFCPRCRARVEQKEEALAQTLWQPDVEVQDIQHADAMLTRMLETLPVEPLQPPVDVPTQELQLDNRRFVLPKVIGRQIQRVGDWSRLPGRLNQSRLELDSVDSRCFFIHMDADAKVPHHTHQGQEVTLVLHGGFNDEAGEYRAGDFICLDGDHRHQPYTDAHEDCLVISALDAPLQFTTGVARLLNPLSSLFFR